MRSSWAWLWCLGCLGPSDEDGDGFSVAKGDCDDQDAAIRPDAEETCDGIDQDCDNVPDDNAVDSETFFLDGDGDGYGTDDGSVGDCEPPAGFASEDGDCDDSDPEIHPGAEDLPTLDRDCDGAIGSSEGSIEDTSISCDGDEVTFQVVADTPAGSGRLYLQETGSGYPSQWAENHDLVVAGGEVGEELEQTLETGAILGEWAANENTVFSCDQLSDNSYMTYAAVIYDPDGGFMDCVAWGHDVQGMLTRAHLVIGEEPAFDISDCRER